MLRGLLRDSDSSSAVLKVCFFRNFSRFSVRAREQLGEEKLSLGYIVHRNEPAHVFSVFMGAGERRGSDQTLIF